MSNLSELIPAGGGQNNFTFTASGNISNGNAVGINSNGTVSVASNFTSQFGSTTVYESAASYGNKAVYDPDSQKVVFIYQDGGNSSYPTSVVGTVSGSTISFGTPTVISSNSIYQQNSITYDENAQRVVAAYRHSASSSDLMVVAGQVSGTAVTWGTPVTAYTGNSSSFPNVTYDKNAQKVLMIASPYPTGGSGRVVSLSGSTITLGTSATFNANNTSQYMSVSYSDDTQSSLIAFQDYGNSSYGTFVVATISGTSVSFGTKTVFSSVNASYDFSTVYDASAKKVIVSYGQSGAKVVAATPVGTDVAFGSVVSLDSEATASAQSAVAYDSANEKIAVAYYVGSPVRYFVKTATVSGLTITPDDGRTEVPATGSGYGYVQVNAMTYDSNAGKIVAAYPDSGNSNYGTGAVFTVGNLDKKFMGLAGQAISDGATGTINTPGAINESQSGLTIGSDYYVQSDGSLSTTTSNVKVGKAITATTINMKNRS